MELLSISRRGMASIYNIIKKNTAADTLVANLRSLMQKRRLSEAELARQTNIPQATMHKILAGKTEDPRAFTLKTLSNFFDVSMDELLTGMILPEGSTTAKVQSIPIISWKECVNSNEFIAKLTPTNWEHWVISECLGRYTYALSTKPSMSPRFPKDTLLFINPDTSPTDGDYLVVQFPDTDEATLRELSIDGPTQLLLPINPNGETTKLGKDIKILGVLLKSSFSYSKKTIGRH